MELKVDMAGALRKTAALKAIPKAVRRVLQRWGAESVTELKREAGNLRKSGKGRKTSQLARSVGMKMSSDMLAVGTNVTRATDVKYARIQDEGGDIFAKNKKLTVPFPGVKGKARDYKDTFFITSKAGNVILCQRKGRGGLKPLFLLADWVRIPGSGWFSRTMADRESLLNRYMDPEYLYDVAANSTGLGGA